MVKPTVVHTYHGILVNAKKLVTDTHNYLDRSQGIMLSEKKVNFFKYIVWFYLYNVLEIT